MKRPKGLPNRAVDEPEHPNNDKRAEWAAYALDEFGNHTGQARGVELYTMVGDFLTNLAHLCDRTGVDLQECLRDATRHYNAETRGKGVQFTRSDF